MRGEAVRDKLFSLADEKYRQFHSGLCPGTDNIIGVRIPVLRNLAKEIAHSGDFLDFINEEHMYYEETMLCGMIIGFMKDYDTAEKYIADFVPKIDNWAVCDIFCAGLKITKKNLERMYDFIQPYISSENEFDVRFAAVMLLDYYVTDEYIEKTISLLDSIHHDGYYAKMGVAWALSVCYVKYPDITMKYFKGENKLDDFTYNKAISKIIESYRATAQQKEVLRSMKRK